MKTFGELLRGLREERNLPLRKVAAFIDIDPSVLSKIERGERSATRDIVLSAASFFNIDQQSLLNDFLGDTVAHLLYQEDDIESIFKVAGKKIEYLKTNNIYQTQLNFND